MKHAIYIWFQVPHTAIVLQNIECNSMVQTHKGRLTFIYKVDVGIYETFMIN